MSQTPRASVVGLGIELPAKVLTNADLEKIVDTTDEWIVTRTGIRERRIAGDGVTVLQLGVAAANKALAAAGVDPEGVDLIICATDTPDKVFPSTGCAIGHAIGAGGCAAFDIMAACSGFIYGTAVADQFIRAGSAKTVLVVASEVYSRVLNWEDRSTCVLFGDGAAAAVFAASNGDSGVIDSKIHSDGGYGDLLSLNICKPKNRFSPQTRGSNSDFVEMKGNQTFKVAIKKMTDVSRELLARNGLTADDIDMVIPHQANSRIINVVGKNLGVPEEKMFVNIEKYGNTSAASIPIALYEAREQGKIKPGDLLLLVTFGGGFTWGATLLRL